MASSSSSLYTEEYIRFVNDQCKFWHNEQATKDLLHERGFIMQDVEEKVLGFFALHQEIGWGSLVDDPSKVNKT